MNNLFNYPYAGRVAGKITFAGVLSANYKEIFPRCNESTLKGYDQKYKSKILPEIGDLPVEDCTESVLDAVLEKIKAGKTYKDGTIAHFKYLMSVVVEFAVNAGECRNVLYGSSFHTGKKVTQKTIQDNELKQNRKSLSPGEEVALLSRLLLSPEKTTGTNVGLLCMHALGLRNHEACGLTFEAIRSLDKSGDIYVAWIYESTVGKTSELQASGKTKNMGRKIPLYPAFAKYLLALKKCRKQQIAQGIIVLDQGESLETLPIVWSNKSFKQHCTSADLSKAGRIMLQDIKVEKDRLSALSEDLEELAKIEVTDPTLKEEEVSLKDPTAYLLRRNFGTHLSILGFSDEEIAYLMGHKIRTVGLNRSMFSNEDQLRKMFTKLNMRPLFGSNACSRLKEKISSKKPIARSDNVPEASITALATKGAKAAFRLSAKEPGDTVKVTIKKRPNTDAMPVTMWCYDKRHEEMETCDPTVNVMRMYQEAYRKARGDKKLFDAF